MGSQSRNVSALRMAWERLQAMLTPTDWPAELAETLGAFPEIVLRREVFALTSLAGLAPLRVGFASDFHAGPTTSDRAHDRAAALLAEGAPDVLLLGGDFVSVRAGYIDRIAPRLGEVPAPLGRFAVLGNHDHWTDARAITNALERAGIEVLINANRRLPPPYHDITLCGIDDHGAGAPDAGKTFAGATPVRLVLMHAPSGLLDLGAYDFTVALAGHTHGGQIALPNGYPPYMPHGPLSRRYRAGRYELTERRTLLVSRGVGCSTVPLRWNAPPEVHHCTFGG